MNAARPKKSNKTRQVLSALRKRITDGRYRPGDKLPTYDEMEAEFDVSRMVLQQAVGRLRDDGFVRSFNRKGLFVSDAPPHLCRVALLFADSPGDPTWSRMNSALSNETRRLAREHADWRFKIFDGMVGKPTSATKFAELQDDIRARRVAGIVYTPRTFELRSNRAADAPAIPQAFLSAHASEGLSPVIDLDSNRLYQRALTRLVEKGRRRIAILHMADTTFDVNHDALFAEVGLKVHKPWIQWVGRSHPEFAEKLVPLLLDYPATQRPDGLIIADDNLIEHASAGVVASGVRVGVDLDVIAHCNWPWPLPSILPIERIGFDATDLLRRAIEGILAQRDHAAFPAEQKVPPLFEWEVEPPRVLPSPRELGTRPAKRKRDAALAVV